MHGMSEDPAAVVGLDGLSDDPLRMPPPYWRSGGGILHIQRSVSEIATKLLPALIPAEEEWKKVANEIDPDADSDGDEIPHQNELEALIYLDSEIHRLSDLSIFMAAIEAEDAINEFAVFNIHKDAAEAIEKLSPPDKLILVAALVGAAPVKGTSKFEAIRKLTSWRNAAAHGHCVDRPTGSLRKNHLISPVDLPNIPAKLAELKARLGDYFEVKEFLKGISVNSYTAACSLDDEEIADSLKVIARYKFEDFIGWVYDIDAPAD